MGLPLYDPRACYEELKYHIGHRVVVVGYGDENHPVNVAVECETCGQVIIDFDEPDNNPCRECIEERLHDCDSCSVPDEKE